MFVLTGISYASVTKPPRMVVGSPERGKAYLARKFQPATSRGGFSFGGVGKVFGCGFASGMCLAVSRVASQLKRIPVNTDTQCHF